MPAERESPGRLYVSLMRHEIVIIKKIGLDILYGATMPYFGCKYVL